MESKPSSSVSVVRRSFVARIEKYSGTERLKEFFSDLPQSDTHYELHKGLKNALQYQQTEIACQRMGQAVERELTKIEKMLLTSQEMGGTID